MEYFIGALKKYAEFSGRARRKEYWMFILIYTIVIIAATVVDVLIGMNILSVVVSFALLVPSISIATRRLHDTGRSGWWQLIGIVPIVGFIVLLVFLIQNSHDANDYGVNPKDGVPA